MFKACAGKRHENTVAAEQIELAQIRVTNAIRSFFPQITLQRESSKGKRP
jgi:hypothetical protein